MKTLAQLKRDAASGRMSLELLERYGETNFPERLKGVRRITKTNTVGATLVDQYGKESNLRYGRASLMSYDGNTLVFYNSAARELNEEEKAVLRKWESVEKEYEEKNPYGNVYWKKKEFFKNCPYPYLSGFSTASNDIFVYDRGKGVIYDPTIKGEAILKYRVYMGISAWDGHTGKHDSEYDYY